MEVKMGVVVEVETLLVAVWDVALQTSEARCPMSKCKGGGCSSPEECGSIYGIESRDCEERALEVISWRRGTQTDTTDKCGDRQSLGQMWKSLCCNSGIEGCHNTLNKSRSPVRRLATFFKFLRHRTVQFILNAKNAGRGSAGGPSGSWSPCVWDWRELLCWRRS